MKRTVGHRKLNPASWLGHGEAPIPAGSSTIEGVPDDARERAAILALIKRAGSGWPDVAAEVLDRGNATELLGEGMGLNALFPDPSSIEELITEAAATLREWEAAGLGVHTVVDQSYPPQHQGDRRCRQPERQRTRPFVRY